jgi:hypothetical protein
MSARKIAASAKITNKMITIGGILTPSFVKNEILKLG